MAMFVLSGVGLRGSSVAGAKTAGTVDASGSSGPGLFPLPETMPDQGQDPIALATADFDGDGRRDVATANFGNDPLSVDYPSVAVYLSRGDGKFAPERQFAVGGRDFGPDGVSTWGPRSIAAGDVTGDGKPDLVIANQNAPAGAPAISVLRNLGGGNFADQVQFQAGGDASWVSLVDVDRDGALDIVASVLGANPDDATGHTVAVLHNRNGASGSWFDAPVSYPVGVFPRSVNQADLNRDGWPDLVTADWADDSISVLMNQRNGTFAPRVVYPNVGDGPEQTALVDLDGDGDPDLAVANELSGDVTVMVNDGHGALTSPVHYATGEYSISLAAGDVTGDGLPELAVGAATPNRVVVLRNQGAAHFGDAVSYLTGGHRWLEPPCVSGQPCLEGPGGVVMSDLDDDGLLDIAIANTTHGSFCFCDNGQWLPGWGTYGASVGLLRNRGDGTFAPGPQGHYDHEISVIATHSPQGKSSYAVADFNHDGHPDLAFTNTEFGTVYVGLNRGDGSFGTFQGYRQPSFAAVGTLETGDFNHDSLPDIHVTSPGYSAVWLMLGRGNGTFRVSSPEQLPQYPGDDEAFDPMRSSSADVDRDGNTDVLLTSNGRQSGLLVRINRGNGTWSTVRVGADRSFVRGRFADLDRDGLPDVVAADGNGETVWFRNLGNHLFAAAASLCSAASLTDDMNLADLNGDHVPDVVMSLHAVLDDPVSSPFGNTALAMCLSTGPARYGPVTTAGNGSARDLVFADFDGDGSTDIGVTTPPGNWATHFSVLLNLGNGTFAEPVNYASALTSTGLVTADFNADGRPDVALGDVDVVLNTSPAARRVSVNWSAKDRDRLLQMAAYLHLTPEAVQKQGVQVLAYLQALKGSTATTPASLPAVGHDARYVSTWARSDLATLYRVEHQYVVNDEDAHRLGVYFLSYLLALGGH